MKKLKIIKKLILTTNKEVGTILYELLIKYLFRLLKTSFNYKLKSFKFLKNLCES